MKKAFAKKGFLEKIKLLSLCILMMIMLGQGARVFAAAGESLNYSNLKAAIDRATVFILDEEFMNRYTEESTQNFLWVYNRAKEICDNNSAKSQEEIDDGIRTLEFLQNSLILKVFDVAFECNGGSENDVQKVTYGYKVTEPEVPVREGYIFGGWFIDEYFDEEYDFEQPVKNDMILYAKWSVDATRLRQAIEYAENVLADKEALVPYSEDSIATYQEVMEFAVELVEEDYLETVEEMEEYIDILTSPEEVFELKEFTVSFESNEGSLVENQRVLYGSQATEPEAPVRTGYLFARWYIDEDFEEAYDFANEVKQNYVLYAKWDVDYQTLVQAVNEATADLKDKSFLEPFTEESIQNYQDKLDAAEKMLSEKNAETAQDVTERIAALAQGKKELARKAFTITFVSDDGEILSSQVVLFGDMVTAPEPPCKKDYLFDAWCMDAGGTTEFDFTTAIMMDTTIYARWNVDYAELSQAIAYAKDKLDNAEMMAPYTKESIKNYANVIEKAEKMLNGETANTASDTKAMIEELKAVEESLEVSKFQFVFDSNGGTSLKEKIIYYGDMAMEPEAPTREGYLFKGWFVDEELTELYNFTTKVTADCTVYAKWTVDYAVLAQELKHVEDILGNDMLLASYTDKTVQRLENAYNKAKKIYDSQSALTALEVKNLIAEMNNAEKSLTVKVFLITFESNEGSEIASQNVEYNNKVIYPEAPEREGYCFDGWYVNDEFTTAFDFATQIKDDYVLYAKWSLDYRTLETAIAQAREVVNDTVLMEQYADATVFAYMSIIEGATEVLEEQSAESPDEIIEIIEALQDAREALTIKTLAVSFNTNEGSLVATKYVTYGNPVNKPSNPSRRGYVFAGWYTDKELNQVYDFTVRVKKDITIYARWEIDYADLEKAIQTAGKTLEDQVYLAPYTSESIKAYGRITEEAKVMIANNTATCADDVNELVALLENPLETLVKKKLTVTFETNGGTLIASQTVTYGESARKPANPTRTDFIFAGWYTDEGFSKTYVFTSQVKQDTVIYVKWILDYSQLKVVVQDANKKLTNMEFLAPYTSDSIKNYENAYREASSMLEQQTADSVDSITAMINAIRGAEKALTKKTLMVRFETNGGTEIAKQEVFYGDYVAKVKAPVKENYNFAGWFADKACTKAFKFSNQVKQDIIIYAKWDVDYTKLEEAISYAESKLSNETLMAPYTEQSIDNYRKVLENAKAVCNSQSAETAEDMLGLVDELSKAFNALEVKNYQVSFNSNGGSSVETQTVAYGACATEPAEPTKSGYVFAGWFKQETLQEIYNFIDEIKANVVVYAKWNIDYSALSAQVKVAEEQLKDSTFTAPYTADSLQNYQNILTRAKQVLMEESAISADEVSLLIQELKAAAGGLGRKVLTVKFDTNGGSQVAAQRIGYGDSLATIETPARDGYDFIGWYKDQGLSENFDQRLKIVDNMTIYAGWALSYQELNKTVSVAEEKMKEAEFEAKYKKTSLLAFHSAYNKARSMLDAQNAQTPEDIKTAIIALENAQANLAIKTLTVSFVMNGGSAVEKQTVLYGEKAVQPNAPTKAGFTFNNWYTNKTFTNVYDFVAPVKKNVTIYAKWDVFYGSLKEAIQYAQGVLASEDIVSYTETSVEDYRVVLQEAIEMQANDTAKTAEQVASLIEKLNAPQSILIKRVLEVTFDCNGGTAINAQNITYGDKVSMPTAPSKAGYIFIGWYADSALTDDYSLGAPVTESMVLYAKWELNYNALKDALDAANEKITDPDFIPSKTNHTMDNYMDVYNKAKDMLTYKKAVSADDIVRMISELEKAEAQLETRDVTVSFISNCDTMVNPQ
ncbi:MAG TPA: hypothetical protein DCW90_22125, partial [Lachnospiraceae bacterium]|nr:hypothetical protein [Lachnospiraceae bacterium]